MVAVASEKRFTEAEYLALEGVAESRHEFMDGDIIGMAGAELQHNLIAENVKRALGNALENQPCLVIGSDQRLKVEATHEYFYPDAMVTCLGPRLAEPAPRSLLNPQVVIEVLSPSTEARDRGRKWLAYQTISSLTDYVMLGSEMRRVEHYRRASDGSWILRAHTEGAFTLSSGTVLELATSYKRSNFESR
jgi:Uma2 family endonuclease